jgi:hypothetical protein
LLVLQFTNRPTHVQGQIQTAIEIATQFESVTANCGYRTARMAAFLASTWQDSTPHMRLFAAGFRRHALDILLAAGVFAVALAIRLPDLLLTPRYVDEFQQVFWALDIANGTHFPLTGRPSYFGPFFYYLLAFLMRLFGTSILLPRLMVAAVGALTATVAFLGGRLTWGRLAGVVAAGLVASNPVLVINTSHFAQSNSLVPFFITSAIVCLYGGAVRSNSWLVVSAAALGALALQSHPTSAVALVGAALWYLLRGGPLTLLRRKSTYAALGVAFATLLPWIIGLVLGGMRFLNEASKRDYAFQPVSSWADYTGRLPDLARITGIMLAGGIGENASRFQLQVLIFAVLLTVGLILAARNGHGLLLAVLLSTFLLFPMIVVVNGDNRLRYIAFLAPVAFISVGGLAERSVYWITSRTRMTAKTSVYLVSATILFSLGTLYPLPVIQQYYSSAKARFNSNGEYFRMLETVRANQACGRRLFVQQSPVGPGGAASWTGLNSIHYTLLLDGCDHRFAPSSEVLKNMQDGNFDGWMILPPSVAKEYSAYARLDPVHREFLTLFRVRPKDSLPLK